MTLSETVYNYLVSGSYNYCMDIKVDDIPDPSLQFITEKEVFIINYCKHDNYIVMLRSTM